MSLTTTANFQPTKRLSAFYRVEPSYKKRKIASWQEQSDRIQDVSSEKMLQYKSSEELNWRLYTIPNCVQAILARQSHPSQKKQAVTTELEAKHSRDSLVLKSIADWLALQKNFFEAEKKYEEALALDPALSMGPGYATSLLNLKKLSKAKAQYKVLAQENPNDYFALAGWAKILWMQGKFAKAEVKFKESLRIKFQFDCFLALCDSLEGQGKLEEAKTKYLEAIQIDPNNEIALMGLGKNKV